MTRDDRPPDSADPSDPEESPLWGLEERTNRALASTVRRRVLHLLLADERAWALPELATVLAGWDATTKGGMRTPDDRRTIEIALHHEHLPHLDDAGLASYDPVAGTVEPRPVPDGVERVVRAAVDGASED